MKKLVAACALSASAILTIACELKPVQADGGAAPEQRVYTTGSNIGRHSSDAASSGVTAVGRDAAEQQIDVRGTVPLPQGGGH